MRFPSMIRSTIAVFLGLVLAFMLAVAVEVFSAVVHPFPADFDGSFESVAEHVANYPAWILALCGLMYGVGVLASTWLATRLGTGRHPAHGAVVGAMLLMAILYNMVKLPYPSWFEAGMLILFPLGTYFGIRLGTSSNPVQ